MLILTDVYSCGIEVQYSRFDIQFNKNKKLIMNKLRSLYGEKVDTVQFNILDTSNNLKYEKISMFDILKLYENENILGIVWRKSSLLFLPVDYMTWKLLDYVNNIENIGVVTKENALLNEYRIIKLLSHKLIGMSDLFEYSCDSNIVYMYKFPYDLHIIDDYGVFWFKGSSTYCTLGTLYKQFYISEMKNCKNLFLIDAEDRVYKLELNKDVVRLITKYKVLGDKKLC